MIMTNDEAAKILYNEWQGFLEDNLDYAGISDAYKMAIKALEQEPCEDAISRKSAIFLANDLKEDLPDDEYIASMVMAHNEGILEYQTKLSLLPPVTPTIIEVDRGDA